MTIKGLFGRYYGKSQPFKGESAQNRGYLTAEQAIADYVEVLYEIKETYDAYDNAIIGFGGSLGTVSVVIPYTLPAYCKFNLELKWH